MKRALLVGINYVGTDHELHGCINDSNNMKAYLTAQGFTEIKQLLEADATTAGIKAGLQWLTAGTASGDVIVFHYSGHGSQMPRASAPTTFEEIICPVDLDWMTKIISDDDLHNVFNAVPNGVNTTVILDCCHSGTMLEQTGEFIPTATAVAPVSTPAKNLSRFLPPPAGVVSADMTHAEWHASKDVNASALLIAGCGKDQTSADTTFNGQPCGAATAALLQAVGANPNISYKDLINAMEAFMVAGQYSQVPELDGDSSLYGQTFLQPFSFAIPAATPAGPVSVSTSSSNTKVIIGLILVIAMIVAYIMFA